MQKTKIFRKLMGAVLCAGMLVGLAGSMSVTAQAALKTVNISAVYGKTKIINDLKTVPIVSSETKISFSKTSKGIKFKSQQEGLVKFKADGKNYRVLVIPDNLPKNKNGKINSCGETEDVVLPANSRQNYTILNYGFCPSNVKIVDFHAYITK